MPIKALLPEQLRHTCDPKTLGFEITDDLEDANPIIGQPRGVRAIDFGIGMPCRGYNIFIVGESGTGRATTIQRFLEERTLNVAVPADWVYVNNFAAPHQPIALKLAPGQGNLFRERVQELITTLRTDLPKAFNTEAYQETLEEVQGGVGEQQDALLEALHEEARARSFNLMQTASGLAVVPVRDGQVMTSEMFAQLSREEQKEIEDNRELLNEQLDRALAVIYQLDREVRQEVSGLNQHVAEAAMEQPLARLLGFYENNQHIKDYLWSLHQHVLDNLDVFIEEEEMGQEGGRVPEPFDWRQYDVNVFVDQTETEGAPVILDDNPTYHNLMGRIEYEMRYGVMTTHFMNIKAGTLHRANGGYLVINVRDLLPQMDAWEGLKRALKGHRITLQNLDRNQVVTKSLAPEPIPLNVKVILLGGHGFYYGLLDTDEDFQDLFKVKAEFNSVMPRDEEHEQEYALFVANRCRTEGLRHFDKTAVAKLIEFGSWLAGHQQKLSTRFGQITDLIREASYWAGENGQDIVRGEDVQMALRERQNRNNRLEELLQEEIEEGMIFISTDGYVTGQVNGLTVLDMGDYSFGQPGRITARTYAGDRGLVNIEREVDMAGPIHNKGMLILNAYLGGLYARHNSLSLSASLTFEQNYNDIDGDSATSAEAYALLSSLGDFPLRQGIAVTGSMNQWGDIQPIGGATEKIEGFFAVCRMMGLTGDQGVIIPEANVQNLMLSEEVVTAVANGQFHVWPIRHLDEGLSLLSDLPAGEPDEDGLYPEGTAHRAVQEGLWQLTRKNKGDEDEEE
ncbi:MAG TPA: ATP-binding protein [Anaerolineae bacterium]|nr:ATP-binding protein [Anaerolineae bacterium]